MRTQSVCVLALVVTTLTVAACGSSSNEASPTVTTSSTPTPTATSAPATPSPTIAPTASPTPVPTPTPLAGQLGEIQSRLATLAVDLGTVSDTYCYASDRIDGLPGVGSCTGNFNGVDASWQQILVGATIFADPTSAATDFDRGGGPQGDVRYIDQPIPADESEFFLLNTPGNEIGPCTLALNIRTGSLIVSVSLPPSGATCPPWDARHTDAMLNAARAMLG